MNFIDKIKFQAQKAGIDPALACAIVEQESSGNTWAIRYEPAFYTHYIVPLKLGATESFARSTSWGLMQLMGECAREHGYKGDLAALCDPDTGLTWGLIHFKSKLELAKGDISKALQFWNGGGAPNYASEVLARVAQYN